MRFFYIVAGGLYIVLLVFIFISMGFHLVPCISFILLLVDYTLSLSVLFFPRALNISVASCFKAAFTYGLGAFITCWGRR